MWECVVDQLEVNLGALDMIWQGMNLTTTRLGFNFNQAIQKNIPGRSSSELYISQILEPENHQSFS